VTRSEAINAITSERIRQDALKAEGRFRFTVNESALSESERLAILVEEVGEVARCVCEGNDRGVLDRVALRAELVQVAAVALAWLEGLEAT
jgi:NTP pyrophosphatase (non-canonical NTP hydrolase)